MIQSCLNLDLTDDLEGRYETDCAGVVEEFEELGCTPDDGEGLMLSMLSTDPAMWEGLEERYPSCFERT